MTRDWFILIVGVLLMVMVSPLLILGMMLLAKFVFTFFGGWLS